MALPPVFKPLQSLPGYNSGATYLPAYTGLPQAYPDRIPRQYASLDTSNLPRLSAPANNQAIGGGAGSSSVGGSGYMGAGGADQVGVAPSNDTYTPAGPFGDASFQFGSFGGTPQFGNSGGNYNYNYSPNVLPNGPLDGLPKLPTEADVSGAITPAQIASGALSLAGMFIPGVSALSSLYNGITGFNQGLDTAKYGNTQTQYAIGDGSTSQPVDNSKSTGRQILDTVLSPSNTIGNILGRAYGDLTGVGQSPIDANPSVMSAGPAFQSFANAYSGDPNQTSNPGGYDPNMALANANLRANTYAGLTPEQLNSLLGTPTLPEQSSNPYSLTGDLSATFMQGAGFGGAGYGYGGANPFDNPNNYYDPSFLNGMVGGPLPPNWTT